MVSLYIEYGPSKLEINILFLSFYFIMSIKLESLSDIWNLHSLYCCSVFLMLKL